MTVDGESSMAILSRINLTIVHTVLGRTCTESFPSFLDVVHFLKVMIEVGSFELFVE